jgi:FkbM family methyltransferase
MDVSRQLHITPAEARAAQWLRDRGDETLRVNYDLGPESLVVDLGGYKGQWTSDIFARYGCRIHVFEPVPQFAQDISRRFARNPKIHTHAFGLGKTDCAIEFAVQGDGTGQFGSGTDKIQAKIVQADRFLKQQDLLPIDLLKINIEGGEYDLLTHLLDMGLIPRILAIQVQFHDISPESEIQMKRIQSRLAESHHLTYQYPFVWENWELRKR